MNCAELEELAGALALGAALPEEVEAARAHLSSCPRAHDLLRELTATASLLAEAVEPAEPPARLRGRILAAARAEQDASAPSGAAPATATDAAVPDTMPVSLRPRPQRDAEPASRPAPVTAVEPAPRELAAPVPLRGGRGPAPWTGWLAAAAVLAAAVGLGAWNLQLRGDVDERNDRLAALRQGGVVAPFTAASPEQASVRGYVVRPNQGAPVAVLQGLSPVPEGQVYQFWAMKGDTARPLETLTPAPGIAAVVALSDLGDADRIGITVERGRQPQPTRPPVLTASLAG